MASALPSWMALTSRRFRRFLMVGLLNTAFGYAVFALCVMMGAGPALAALVSTIAGIAFNFVSTGRFVFGYRGCRALPGFIGVYVGVYLINVAGLAFLINAGATALLAQLLLLPLLVVTSFVGMNRFVFPERTT